MLFTCPTCRTGLELPSNATEVRCPECGAVFSPSDRAIPVPVPPEPGADATTSLPTDGRPVPAPDLRGSVVNPGTEPATRDGGAAAVPDSASPDDGTGGDAGQMRVGETFPTEPLSKWRWLILVPFVALVVCALTGKYWWPWVFPDPEAEREAFVRKLGGEVTHDYESPEKPDAVRVNLRDRRVTDVELAKLVELFAHENLTALDLSNTAVTDAGLKELAPLQNLTTLYLWNTQVTAEGVKELATLKKLSRVGLSVTDRHLAVLREIDLLHLIGKIDRNETRPTRNETRPTKREEVTALNLGGAQVTDAGLKELATLKNLTILELFRTNVTDAGLKELAPLQNLTTLFLSDTAVTEAGLKELVPLKNLTTLHLDGAQVTDAVVFPTNSGQRECGVNSEQEEIHR